MLVRYNAHKWENFIDGYYFKENPSYMIEINEIDKKREKEWGLEI